MLMQLYCLKSEEKLETNYKGGGGGGTCHCQVTVNMWHYVIEFTSQLINRMYWWKGIGENWKYDNCHEGRYLNVYRENNRTFKIPHSSRLSCVNDFLEFLTFVIFTVTKLAYRLVKKKVKFYKMS